MKFVKKKTKEKNNMTELEEELEKILDEIWQLTQEKWIKEKEIERNKYE